MKENFLEDEFWKETVVIEIIKFQRSSHFRICKISKSERIYYLYFLSFVFSGYYFSSQFHLPEHGGKAGDMKLPISRDVLNEKERF